MAFTLPRLTVNWEQQPELLSRYWNEVVTKLEQTLDQILDIPLIQQALEDLDAATTAAQTAADSANNAADATASESALVNSFIDPSSFTDPLISSDTSGNVTIKTHERVYGDGTSVSVTGGTLATAESAGSVLRFYYDDASRAGGAVTYLYTVDPAVPPVQGGNRHSVAVVEVPVVGTSDGNYIRNPGWIEP